MHSQVDRVRDGRRGGHLAEIGAGVGESYVMYLEDPLLTSGRVKGHEARVRRVGDGPRRQKAYVAPSDPGYLKEEVEGRRRA